MVYVNIQDLIHNFSKYLKKVKSGERIIIMERNYPVADLIPHNENVNQPGWKRPIKRIKIKGGSASETVVKNRREERY